MWTADVVVEHLDLLLEVESIAGALTVIEQRHGGHVDIEDVRRRLQQIRVVVLAQLLTLLRTPPPVTVH
jgi:hypothetical protein